jgi:hypothetical protein
MEHRWGTRSVLDAAVRLLSGSRNAVSGHITNASLSGAFIRMGARLPVFGYVLVELDGSGSRHRAPPRIPAYVVRQTPDGIAVEWCEFAPPAITSLLMGLPSPVTGRLEARPCKPVLQAHCV